MNNSRFILVIALCVVVFPALAISDENSNECIQRGIKQFEALQGLRSSDPEITAEPIRMLFEMGGQVQLTMLYWKWVVESNPDIRKQILDGFSNLHREERIITDPKFPKGWIDAAQRFSSPEKESRMDEIYRYFPKEMKKYVR